MFWLRKKIHKNKEIKYKRGNMRRFRIECLIILAISTVAILPLSASAMVGTYPWAVVLCKFNDSQTELKTVQYFQDMFTVPNNPTYQYWKDISYGKLDLSGTIVAGNRWYTLGISKSHFDNMTDPVTGNRAPYNRWIKIQTCANAAAGDVDFSKYYGVVAITDGGSEEDGGAAGTGPITLKIGGNNYQVGAVLASTVSDLSFMDHEMGHGIGFSHSRSINFVETGNEGGTGWPDYRDCWDLMSVWSCTFRVSGKFPDDNTLNAGPGLNAINLDVMDWFPLDTPMQFITGGGNCGGNPTPADISVMAPLNHPNFNRGFTEIHIGANVIIPPRDTFGGTIGDRYVVEFRDKSDWDAAIPQDSVVLHVRGKDGFSYLVDSATPQSLGFFGNVGYYGAMLPGGEYSDPGSNFTIAVNDINTSYIDPTNHYAIVSIGAPTCPMETSLNYTGQTSGNFNDFASLSANLKVISLGQGDTDFPSLSSAQIPYATVKLNLGGSEYNVLTDANGYISRRLYLTQVPGTYTLSVTFDKDSVYAGSSISKSFTINKQGTNVQVVGPALIVQGQPLNLTGTLSQSSGLSTPGYTIVGNSLTLSVGNQSCNGVLDNNGKASCTIPSVSADTGPQQIGANFSGNAYYLPSSSTLQVTVFAFPNGDAFVIGDKTESASTPTTNVTFWNTTTNVTFWSNNWSGVNSLTGGTAPFSFKGFAVNPSTKPPKCGGNFWTSTKGNSVSPPSSVPSYMGVIVSSSINSSGKNLTGNIVKIDVLKTNPGYAPNPNSRGTGTIVATYCS